MRKTRQTRKAHPVMPSKCAGRCARLTVALLFAVVVALSPAAVSASFDAPDGAAVALALFEASNADRAAAGVGLLEPDEQTPWIAERRAEAQVGRAELSHDIDAKGVPEMARLVDKYVCAGENLARVDLRVLAPMSEGDIAQTVERAWMASGAHRENILLPRYTRLSIAVVVSPDGCLYVAEIFREPVW